MGLLERIWWSKSATSSQPGGTKEIPQVMTPFIHERMHPEAAKEKRNGNPHILVYARLLFVMVYCGFLWSKCVL